MRREFEQKANGTYFSLQSAVCECQRGNLKELTVDLRRTKSQARAISRYTEILDTVDSPQVQPAYGSARGNVVWKKVKNIFSGLLNPGGRPMPVDGPSFASQSFNTSAYEKKTVIYWEAPQVR
jgi:hypothetical protein